MLSAYNAFIPKSGRLKDILIWFFYVLVFFGLGVIFSGAVAGALMGRVSLETATLLSYPVMFIPLMIAAIRKPRPGGAPMVVDSPLRESGIGILWAAALSLLTLFAGFMCDALVSLFPAMPQNLKDALEAMTSGNLWVNLLCTAVFAPFFEEWLCRGIVLRGFLKGGVKPALAVVLSSLFFALIHANIWQGAPAFIIGCLLGFVYYRTGSLKLTMLLHCVNNAFSVLLSRIEAFEDAESWLEVMPHTLYWIFFTVFAILSFMIIKYFSNNRHRG